MDRIVNVQKDLQKTIEKGFVKFTKSPKDRITVEYLETRLENLERDWQLFHVNNSKLYETQTPEDIQFSSYVIDDVYDKTEDTYISYKSILKVEINKLKSVNKVSNVQITENTASNENSSFVKLPKISIPIFSGKYTEWQTFRDLFLSLVHNNKSLDSVQKLHYLKGHLTGEAEQLIRHTPITQANYSQCWEQLEKRYNNKRYLANCILKRLFSQRRLAFESSSGLKELLDNTSDCLNALSNLGVDVSTWDILVIHIVAFKLDLETRKQWELSVSSSDSNDLPTFDQFKLFLEKRFRAFECLDSKKSTFQQVNTKSFLATSNIHTILCEFCSEGHKLCFCKKFINLTTEQRREFVSKNKMCFNCLGGNHTVYDCKKPTTCKICRKRHHSLLHLQYSNEKKGQHSVQKEGTQASTSEHSSPIVTCLSTGEVPKQVLLATTLVNVQSRTGDYQVGRALLDQGSQACFITEEAVQRLKLKKNPVRGVVSGLGENKEIVTKSTVNVVIQSRYDPDFKIPIQMFVLSNITSDLPEKHIESLEWINNAHLKLADPQFHTPNKIDVLLGAEVYCKIINNGILKSPNNQLVAQSTKLGWILSGVLKSTESSSGQTKNNMKHPPGANTIPLVTRSNYYQKTSRARSDN
ncbi:hypothetical protein ABMA28_017285 [Loxostege sticticalis]|uniref:Peptidase aspartic putative domain-containing protein n=1 Tax=Loxostege sticticalis TaxID=481309 RepID=A0ABD0S1X1_LOXSC